MSSRPASFLAAMLVFLCAPAPGHATGDDHSAIRSAVNETVQPVMQQYGIPGMAVGIVAGDERFIFNYGVMSEETGKPVTGDTLFEIGSISKTFTATLASIAQAEGKLSLSDSVSKHLPSLKGGSFDKVSVLHLGTHTPGGMPLQFPDGIANGTQLMEYFRNWKPAYAPGTYRTYSNPSIGLLGMVAAASMNGDFATLMQEKLFAPLMLNRTYLDVPEAEKQNYAQGYTKKDEPIRMSPGVLASEAYGVRTTASDLVRFVEANMDMLELDEKVQRAITDTHTGYFGVGKMTQALIWEQYPYSVDLKDLLAGNSPKIAYEANPVITIEPPLQPQKNVLINKTGSTNGFGAYVAFIPEKKLGVVLLANKNYPIEARVSAAHQILTRLNAVIMCRDLKKEMALTRPEDLEFRVLSSFISVLCRNG